MNLGLLTETKFGSNPSNKSDQDPTKTPGSGSATMLKNTYFHVSRILQENIQEITTSSFFSSGFRIPVVLRTSGLDPDLALEKKDFDPHKTTPIRIQIQCNKIYP